MIKFFRRIRHKLLTENKFSKYLLYAFGEIVLVVIGILIALSINTWNESNKDTKKEISYLNNLVNELETNKDWAEFYIEFSKTQYVAANYLSDVINSKIDSLEIEIFVDAIFRCHYLPHPNSSKNVWEELKSTGDLANEIIDFEIIKKLAEKRIKPNKIDNSFIESEFSVNRHQLNLMIEEFKAVEGIPGLLADIFINRTVAEMTYKHILDETNRVQFIIKEEIESIK